MDLLIPAAPKDYVKLPHVLEAVALHIPEISRVCLVTPEVYKIGSVGHIWVDCFVDAEVLPDWYDRSVVGWRPNWTSQQMIKLCQKITQGDYWLTIDADTFFNRRTPLFNETNKPILYTGLDQYYPPYFSFNEALFGYGKLRPESFLSECTLYNRKVMDELLVSVGGCDEFIRKTTEIINTGKGHPGDSEIYAAYVLRHYPDMYEIRKLRQNVHGRYGSGAYTNQEIVSAREENHNIDVQTFSLHSWSEYWN